MITERDLHAAIAECHGQRNPNANTCVKLASFYTILDHIKAEEEPQEYPQTYSYAMPDRYESESEFGQIMSRVDQIEALRVIDELMETLRIMQPKLYDAFMRGLNALE